MVRFPLFQSSHQITNLLKNSYLYSWIPSSYVGYQKDGDTTQKTIQKNAQKNTQKNAQKEIVHLLGEKKPLLSDKQILVLTQIYLNPQITRRGLCKIIDDLTDDSAKYIIGYLQELGLLRREGGRKNGRWVVMLDNNENEKGE